MLKRRNNLGGIANKPGVSLPYVGAVLMLGEWVDFHYEVDGKTYDLSIPGGGFISLKQLVGDLNIADDAERFVTDVENVEFSDPELVWVGKAEKDTTVGELKDDNALKISYSTALMEEQMAEINAQTVQAGEWALISLLPFTSEETLTVTMKDGEQFTVKVTDSQVNSVADGQKYLIYYNSTHGSTLYYYVLKNDGSVYTTANSADLDTLGDEYLWTFDYFDRFGLPYALIHNESTYLTLDGSSSGIFSNLPIPTYLSSIDDNNGGYKLYGLEWVSTGLFTGYYNYNYLTFNGSNFIRNNNENGNTRIKLWEQETRKYQFTVKTQYNNIFRGTVSGIDENNSQQNNVASFVGITANNKTNQSKITATAGEGYRFKEWRLGDEVIPGGATIDAGTLTFPDDNMILTAVFEKDPEKPDVGVDDYSQMIEDWKNQHMNQPVNLDKTAQVYDYDNRIYEVGLDASAKARDIEKDVEMAFVTDVSRSMYTPAELVEVGTYTSRQDLINQLNRLKSNRVSETQSGDGDDVYYLMADEDTSALVFAVRKIGTSSQYKYWKWIDCSYDTYTYNDKIVPAGINTDSDDKSWRDGNNGGGYLYVRASDVDGKVKFINGTYTLNGKIYVAKDVRYRLDYLQQAVDIVSDVLYTVNPGAKTGLVTFDATAHGPYGLYGKDQYGELITAINNISPNGNTNQAAGLNLASELWDTAADDDHQRAVMLITDGAPNGGKNNPVTWDDICDAAEDLNTQKGAIVHTVGLSVNNVTGAPDGLRDTAAAGGGGMTMMPENGTQLVSSVLDIIATYLKDCNYKGTLHDDIDPAFYPVKKDGTPIAPGYYDVDGKLLDQSMVQAYNEAGTEYYLWKYNNDSSWSITWYNLEFGRGTTESPATHKNIYLKAREDFMGGNKIETNIDSAHAIASKAVFKDEQGQTTKERFLEVIKDGMADTPYVNVDELHMTEHETEWTVYLGTDVTPKEQLEALWNNIKVKQVIKEAQHTDPQDPGDVTQMKDKAQMWYAHSSAVDVADENAPANSDACSKLPLSHYGLDSYYDALLTAITTGTSYDSDDITYSDYGHSGVGKFRITATKTIVDGAVDASGKAPNQHTTDKAASPAETYKITVTYTPSTTDAANTYTYTTANGSAGQVTSGTGNDEVKSENTHKIKVIKKGFEIEKVDDQGNKITDESATFKLYRPAQTGENGTNVEGLEGSYIEVATLITNNGTASLADTLQELRKLPDGQHYYLKEEQEPTGYIKLSGPIQVDISVTEGDETKPYESTEGITDLINIGKKTLPTASISVTGTDAQVLSDSNGKFVIKVINKPGTVDIIINKVDNKNTPLPGATFKLLNGSEIVSVASSGTGVVVEPKVSTETVTITDKTFTIPSGGVTIRNIPVSQKTYSIVEVNAPEGYVLTNNTPATFKVTPGNVTEEQHITGVTYTAATKEFTIPNEPGAELPSTGGPGTRIFYLLGVLLATLAGTAFVMRRRMRNN